MSNDFYLFFFCEFSSSQFAVNLLPISLTFCDDPKIFSKKKKTTKKNNNNNVL